MRWPRRFDPKLERLAGVPALRGLGRRKLHAVARLADEVVVAPGAPVTRAGRPATQGFLVLSGRLVAREPGGALWLLGPGGAAGPAEVAARRPYAADVTALTRSTLLVLTPRVLASVLALAPELRATFALAPELPAAAGGEPSEPDAPQPGPAALPDGGSGRDRGDRQQPA